MIIVAALSAGIAAYDWQSPPKAGFDSDLHEFLQRTNSSLLIVSRLQDTEAAAKHFDEYSLAASNQALYRHFSAVDAANELSPAPGDEPHVASIEVVISHSESRAIQRQISPELQESREGFDIFAEDIKVDGRLYSLVLMIPK